MTTIRKNPPSPYLPRNRWITRKARPQKDPILAPRKLMRTWPLRSKETHVATRTHRPKEFRRRIPLTLMVTKLQLNIPSCLGSLLFSIRLRKIIALLLYLACRKNWLLRSLLRILFLTPLVNTWTRRKAPLVH